MKIEECQYNTRVALLQTRQPPKLPYQKGTIVGTPDPTQKVPLVKVDWDNGTTQHTTLRSLILEEEALDQEYAVEQALLKKSGQTIPQQIKIKLSQAAKLIQEADLLAKKQHTLLNTDYKEATDLLERSLQEAGWQMVVDIVPETSND